MSKPKVVGLAILVTAGILSFSFMMKSIGMWNQGFFGKWTESNRYEIQKESQAYRDGMQRNLSQMQQQYLSADTAGKAAIEQAVRQQYSQTDTSEYPLYLQNFLRQMGM